MTALHASIKIGMGLNGECSPRTCVKSSADKKGFHCAALDAVLFRHIA
jgi:hypothetical protein